LVVSVAIGAGACGAPSGLDREEQVAFARACASLVERGLSDKRPPRSALLGGTEISLDDPVAFYSTLEELRGPSTFIFDDPEHTTSIARQPLDNCDTKPAILKSFLPTTTTSTTTTTAPGS
jgi:hypothetical protein